MVTIENTHAQMLHTDSVARAARRASRGHGHGAALGHALHPLGVHSHVHLERARSLAVHAADPGGGILHDRLLHACPAPSCRCSRYGWCVTRASTRPKSGLFDKLLRVYNRMVAAVIRHRWIAVPGYRRGLRAAVVAGRQPGGKGTLSPGRFRPVRDPLPRAAGVRVRAHAETRRQDAGGHRPGDRAQGGDLDGLRRPGGHQHRHQQHAALHARPGRRADPRAALGRVGPARGRTSRTSAQGPARAVGPLDEGGIAAGRLLGRGGAVAGREDLFRLRAGRHRQRGHELRLADPGRGDGGRPGPGRGAQARPARPRRDEEDSRPPRRAALPAARLPDRAGGHRPSRKRASAA